jgi:hypothetical protein
MDRLDRYANTLVQEYRRGKRRRSHPEYARIGKQRRQLRQEGELERAKELRKEMQQYPSVDPDDPEYRRLYYVRYADDFLLGFAGPKAEAEEIKERLTTFTKRELKLTLAAEKTLITHAETGRARFLGYEIGVMKSQTQFDELKRRAAIPAHRLVTSSPHVNNMIC